MATGKEAILATRVSFPTLPLIAKNGQRWDFSQAWTIACSPCR
jgi:hypothetical protein